MVNEQDDEVLEATLMLRAALLAHEIAFLIPCDPIDIGEINLCREILEMIDDVAPLPVDTVSREEARSDT